MESVLLDFPDGFALVNSNHVSFLTGDFERSLPRYMMTASNLSWRASG